jgi:hypothetical protein
VGRAFVLGPRQQLRDEDEEDDLARQLGVRSPPAARPHGDEEEPGVIALHRT